MNKGEAIVLPTKICSGLPFLEGCYLTQGFTYEDEIDLRDLIMVIWQGRWWIIWTIVVVATAAFVYATFFGDTVYEATVSFIAPNYHLADDQTLRQAYYLPLFRKESIAAELVRKYDLEPPDIDTAVSRLLADIDPNPGKTIMVLCRCARGSSYLTQHVERLR